MKRIYELAPAVHKPGKKLRVETVFYSLVPNEVLADEIQDIKIEQRIDSSTRVVEEWQRGVIICPIVFSFNNYDDTEIQ